MRSALPAACGLPWLVGFARYCGRVPGDVLDVILVVLAALFAVAGYREGFVVGVLGCVGFLAGAVAGAVFAPKVAQLVVHGAAQQVIAALVMVFITAVAGQLLASLAGVAVRRRFTWRPATFADALGGAVVSVVSVLFIAGFIGSAVAGAPPSVVSRQVDSSVVLKGVDQILPPAGFSSLRGLLGDSPYGQLFGPFGLAGGPRIAPVDGRVLDSPGLGTDKPSIVKITGLAPGCRPAALQEGTGLVFAPHHILTNAHVVAGVTKGPWVSNGQARPVLARVVLFDPRRDLAVLYAPQLSAPPLHFARHAVAGGDAIVAGYPRGQPLTAVPARVGDQVAAQSPDIYLAGTVIRDIYWIRARVEPGNSGGPLLAPNGTIYGVVFATSTVQPGYAVALTSGEVLPDARASAAATTPVSTQNCTPDGANTGLAG
jgi:S1-C subfamily serine protease